MDKAEIRCFRNDRTNQDGLWGTEIADPHASSLWHTPWWLRKRFHEDKVNRYMYLSDAM